jgi:hypothetical protein
LYRVDVPQKTVRSPHDIILAEGHGVNRAESVGQVDDLIHRTQIEKPANSRSMNDLAASSEVS